MKLLRKKIPGLVTQGIVTSVNDGWKNDFVFLPRRVAAAPHVILFEYVVDGIRYRGTACYDKALVDAGVSDRTDRLRVTHKIYASVGFHAILEIKD